MTSSHKDHNLEKTSVHPQNTWNDYPYHTRVEIPIQMITPNKDNKEIFSVDDIDRLATAIRRFGFRGSIEVYPDSQNPNLLEINAGERRYRAAIKAGLTSIPTIIYERPDEATVMETLLSSNVNTREQTPLQRIREIKAYKERVVDVRKEKGSSIKKCAEFFGMSRSSINRYLELGNLSEELLSLCDDDDFPYTSLAGAITLSDEEQLELYQRICDKMNQRPFPEITSAEVKALISAYKKELALARFCETEEEDSSDVIFGVESDEDAESTWFPHLQSDSKKQKNDMDDSITQIRCQLQTILENDYTISNTDVVLTDLTKIMDLCEQIRLKVSATDPAGH